MTIRVGGIAHDALLRWVVREREVGGSEARNGGNYRLIEPLKIKGCRKQS